MPPQSREDRIASQKWANCHEHVQSILEQSSQEDVQKAVRSLLDVGDTVSVVYIPTPPL